MAAMLAAMLLAQTGKVEWSKDLDAAQARGKKDGKYVLVHVTGEG
jgi:hypothetical protein